MLKPTWLSDEPASSRNNSSRSAFSKNINSRSVFGSNASNGEFDRFGVSGDGVEYTKKSRKSKGKKLFKS